MNVTRRVIATSLLGWVLYWTTGGSAGTSDYGTKATCEVAGRQAAKNQAQLNTKIEAEERANPGASSWEGGTLEWKCNEQGKQNTKTSDSN